MRRIEILMQFYKIKIYVIDVDNNDDFFENKFTENNVNKCMKNLLKHWKIEWKFVCEFKQKHLNLSRSIEKKKSKKTNDEKIQKKFKKINMNNRQINRFFRLLMFAKKTCHFEKKNCLNLLIWFIDHRCLLIYCEFFFVINEINASSFISFCCWRFDTVNEILSFNWSIETHCICMNDNSKTKNSNEKTYFIMI